MAKSPDAFRTISEVAEWLGIQAHVLRFWESKFSQVKPIKRAGGRRYYRPTDMLLLGGIKKLLHDDGLTIKGVQKILREEGMNHVADMSQPLDDQTMSQFDESPAAVPDLIPEPTPVEEEKGVVLNFEAPVSDVTAEDPSEADTEVAEDATLETPAAAAQDDQPEPTEPEPSSVEPAEDETAEEDTAPEVEMQASADAEASEPEPEETERPPLFSRTMGSAPEDDQAAPADGATTQAPEETPEAAGQLTEADEAETAEIEEAEPERAATETQPEEEPETPAPSSALPAFLRKPLDAAPAPEDPAPMVEEVAAADDEVEPAAEPEPVADAPKPRVIDVPLFLAEEKIEAHPALLSNAYGLRQIDRTTAGEMEPLLERLTALRDSMAAQRRGGGAQTPPSS